MVVKTTRKIFRKTTCTLEIIIVLFRQAVSRFSELCENGGSRHIKILTGRTEMPETAHKIMNHQTHINHNDYVNAVCDLSGQMPKFDVMRLFDFHKVLKNSVIVQISV